MYDNLTPALTFNANLETIKKNHREWKRLFNSKKKEKKEILEIIRSEFEPFKAESDKEYAAITIKNLFKIFNTSEKEKEKYTNILLKEF